MENVLHDNMFHFLSDGESHEKTPKVALVSLKKHYATLRDFKIDLNDSESKHVEALVARFRGLSLAPLLECIKDHKEADEMATVSLRDVPRRVLIDLNWGFNVHLFRSELV